MPNTEKIAFKQTKDMLVKRHGQFEALLWPKEKLRIFREERLKSLLNHVKNKSPWYKNRLARIDIEHFTEERLVEIPPLDKVTLMENWNEIITDRSLSLSIVDKHIEKMSYDENTLYLHGRYHVMVTSGSSGTRGVFIYDWEEWIKYYLNYIRYRFYNHDRSALLLNPNKKLTIAMVVASSAVYAMYSLARTFKSSNLETFHFPMTLPINQIVAGLNLTQADVLQGTPTTLYKLCKEMEEGRLKINPKVISVGGEPLYMPIRAALKKNWPCAGIFNTLGTSEGLIAVCCHADSKEMHLNDDACIVQPVDENGNPVKPNTLSSKLYFTNLYNYTLPLIRYEISDQFLFINRACKCGVKHQLIAEPEGRPEFDFIYPGDIFVHHLTYVTPLLHEKNLQEYQVIQTKMGADIKVITTGFVNKKTLQHNIGNTLKKLGLPKPVINIFEVAQLDYPDSGKLRRFLPLNTAVK